MSRFTDSLSIRSPAADRGHVKRHHTPAAVAVGVVAHHAFPLLLTGWTKRKRFQTKLTIVRNLLCFAGSHQLESGVEHVDVSGILLLQRQNLIDQTIAHGPVEPERFVESCDRREEVEDDAAARDWSPLLH